MHKHFSLLFFVMIIAFSAIGQSMNVYSNSFLLDTKMTRKITANEVMVEDSNQYLLVNYGNKPTYIVIFEIGTWEAIANFRLRNWVEFAGTYFHHETNEIFIREGRYASSYYKLKLNTNEVEIVECEKTPRQCPTIEPRKEQVSTYTKDKEYRISIDKKNARNVSVYQRKK